MSSLRLRPILIVEDSDEDYDTAITAIARVGIPNPVLRAQDGDECLELLASAAKAAASESFALVLLDLSLPGTDGRDVLQALRAVPNLRRLPVVVLTTSGSSRDCDACYEAGANAFHKKPVRFDEHLAVLEEIFRYWCRHVVLPAAELRPRVSH
ncbi:response regulator [Polyangium aurulentum]|uniref:response regulator n=1 Tax=Polyangium aurulentum TaxID=2567896 RepID=UPI0010ADCF20|nr:response regulator [Polyangium aurulentum]UQA62554.1 response regulator [Polyangium aurulentum]